MCVVRTAHFSPAHPFWASQPRNNYYKQQLEQQQEEEEEGRERENLQLRGAIEEGRKISARMAKKM